MKNRQSYKFPIVISILLHAIIFIFLFLHFSPSNIKATKTVNIVQAVAVNENQLSSPPKAVIKVNPVRQESIRKIEQMALKQSEVSPHPRAENLVQKKETESFRENKKPESLAKEREANSLTEKKKLESLAKERELESLAEEKKAERLAKKKEAENLAEQKHRKKELALKCKAEEAKLLQNALAQEASQIQQEAATTATEKSQSDQKESAALIEAEQASLAQAGEINKYKQLIIDAISRKWLIPDKDDRELACQLLVHVGPGGIVLNVDVIKESGDENLDRSARNAIMKSSPLPVPENQELFDNFRSLRLTFRPQGIVSG